MSKERSTICRSNRCGYYDALGESENTFIKGKPSCKICGCNIKILSNSPESKCSLSEIGQEPLWKEQDHD